MGLSLSRPTTPSPSEALISKTKKRIDFRCEDFLEMATASGCIVDQNIPYLNEELKSITASCLKDESITKLGVSIEKIQEELEKYANVHRFAIRCLLESYHEAVRYFNKAIEKIYPSNGMSERGRKYPTRDDLLIDMKKYCNDSTFPVYYAAIRSAGTLTPALIHSRMEALRRLLYRTASSTAVEAIEHAVFCRKEITLVKIDKIVRTTILQPGEVNGPEICRDAVQQIIQLVDEDVRQLRSLPFATERQIDKARREILLSAQTTMRHIQMLHWNSPEALSIVLDGTLRSRSLLRSRSQSRDQGDDDDLQELIDEDFGAPIPPRELIPGLGSWSTDSYQPPAGASVINRSMDSIDSWTPAASPGYGLRKVRSAAVKSPTPMSLPDKLGSANRS